MTGLGRKQIGRHVKALKAGKNPRAGPDLTRHHFTKQYSQIDIELLAEVDNATDRLSGWLTIALMQNQYDTGDERFLQLRKISVAHLYRLRGTRIYLTNALSISGTKSTKVPIGTRAKPRPNGSPGYIRVDTVHQGDLNGEKWVYHINLVDEVTQWEVTVAVECISEKYLLPALKMALAFFPFIIINFHSDNGSEFINYTVAHLLNKLNIAQTKSRARTSTDNGLVESKNWAIIRKEFGHWHIPRNQAGIINQFYIDHLIPYLNYHRPCHFPFKKQNLANGKITITYPHKDCKTPYQKLLSIPNWEQYLKPWRTVESLKQAAETKTPMQAAKEKKEARDKLMKLVLPKHPDTIPPLLPPMAL
jgi:transposase InsO family protein